MRKLILFAASVFALACAGVEIRFDAPGAVALIQGEKRDQALAPAAPKEGDAPCLKLSWGEQRHRFAELKLRDNRRIAPVGQASAELAVYVPEKTAVGRIGLRFTDAKGETFQFYPVGEGLKRGAWNTLTYRISEADANGSWGGNADRKVDGALRFSGVAVNFPAGSGAGELFIGKLLLHDRQGELLECREPFLNFDRSENFMLSGSSAGAALTLTDSGWEIAGSVEKRKKFTMVDRKLSLTPYAPAYLVVFQLDGAKSAGKGTAALNYTDSTGRKFQAKCGFAPGQKELRFEFPASKAPTGRCSSITVEPEPGEFRLCFTGSERFVRRPPAEAVGFEVETGNPLHLLPAGEEERLAFRFVNRSGSPLELRAELELVDYYGRSVKNAFPLKLAPGEAVSRPLDGTLPARGIWYVSCRIAGADGSGEPAVSKRSFAWLKPAGPTPGRAEGFLFGICSHPQRWSLRDQELEALAMAYCGGKVLRNDAGWGNLQPAPDRWNFESMDRKVELFGRYHIELAPIWAYTPRWAAAPGVRDREWKEWFRSLPDYGAWEKFISATVTRYKGRIRLWEVWNEPDFKGTTCNSDEYAELMKIAWRAAKAADPEVIIQSGGFATVKEHPSRKGNFHEEALVKGRGFFDLHAYHEHGRFASYRAAVEERFLPMRERTGTAVPWYANETALNSLGGERGQAMALFQKLLYSWANGAIGYNWYDLRNDGFDVKNGEHNYGMITNDFHPKAVYVAYNTLAGHFSGAQYLKRIECGSPELYVYLFRRGGELLAGIWNETNRGATIPLLLRTDAAAAESVDLMGNARPLAVQGGVVVAEAGRDPVILRLKGASRCVWAGSLVSIGSGGAAVPGGRVKLEIGVRNPYEQEREFRLKIVAPGGVTAVPAERAVRIAAGGEARWSSELSIPGDYREAAELRLEYAAGTDGASGSVGLPLVPARRMGAGEMKPDAPDFRMDRHDQAVSLFDADPGKVHLTWQGPEDRSARVWLRRDGALLRLRFEVTDDRHVQPNSGVAAWKGDGVQFALLLPGQDRTWEIGLSRLDSGKSEVFAWSAPAGFDAEKSAAGMRLETSRNGTLTCYDAEIPLAVLGTTPEALAAGARFNALVNDDDGEGREGWIQIAPGIGENKDPARYPLILFP
ncbi:MAG: hypothetical protein HPZ91_20605 [Lentisphaeria bacterium]|nr:hypothetical protein [Lentisphaeria bacterium]